MLAQHRHPALLGEIIGRLRRVVDEQRAGPPADFVVREIADPVWRVAVGRDQFAGLDHHSRFDRGVERVEPMELGIAAKLEVNHDRHRQLLRRQRPAAGGVEPPCLEAAGGFRYPIGQRWRERRPAIPGLAVVLSPWVAAVECVDPEAIEALAAGRFEPSRAVIADQRPACCRCGRQIAGRSESRLKQCSGDCCRECESNAEAGR
jgi:hypothetical protein